MNKYTGKMIRQEDLEKMSQADRDKFFPIPPGMPISKVKELSRSQRKRDEYIAEVARKKKEGQNV